MERRQLLITIGAASIAGCAGRDSGASGDGTATSEGETATPTQTATSTQTPTLTPGSGPAEPVIRHYQALDRNDIEAANAAIHVDSPTGGELPEDAVEQARNTDYVIKEVEVLSESSDGAEVRIVVTGTNTETGTKRTNELRIEVRPAGNEWKMWNILSFETLGTTQTG